MTKLNCWRWQFLVEKSNQDSDWKKYIPTFPNEHHNLHLWSDEELSELQSSVCVDKAKYQKESLPESYATWKKHVFDAYPNLFPKKYFDMKTWIWAVDTVWTRYFYHKHSVALIPYIDFANCHVNLVIEMYEDNGTMYLKSDIDLEKGFEVCISYGNKINEEYLLFYGFVMEGNKLNAIKISLDSIGMPNLNPLNLKWKKSLYRSIENFTQKKKSEIAIREVKGKQIVDVLNLLKIIRVFLAGEQLKSCEDSSDLDFEKQVFQFARDNLTKLLKSYGTTIEDDQNILKSSATYRKQLALRFRIMEKSILKSSLECLEVLSQFLIK